MIERDVKQAVKLLEMSLSGLVSAENALKRWKTHIPPKVGLKLLRPRVLTCHLCATLQRRVSRCMHAINISDATVICSDVSAVKKRQFCTFWKHTQQHRILLV